MPYGSFVIKCVMLMLIERFLISNDCSMIGLWSNLSKLLFVWFINNSISRSRSSAVAILIFAVVVVIIDRIIEVTKVIVEVVILVFAVA